MKKNSLPVGLISAIALVVLFAVLAGCTVLSTPPPGGSSHATQTPSHEPPPELTTVPHPSEPPEETGNAYMEPGHMEVIVFGIGRADCILIITENHTVMIDTGSRQHGQQIIRYLRNRNINTIDCLIITHFDSDHVGGAYIVVNELDIVQVIVPNYSRDSNHLLRFRSAMSYAGIEELILTETIRFTFNDVDFIVNPSLLEYNYIPRYDNFEFDPDGEDDDFYGDDETMSLPTGDDYSIIVSVIHGENSFLFTGDAVTGRLLELLENEEIMDICYDFLKVPRHGRHNSRSIEFIRAISPRYAVITGFHPYSLDVYYPERPADERVIAALEDVGAEVFFAMSVGVRIISDGAHLVITEIQ
jgi:glyoxylase-like metal-dependent hydrolase (beta-lactamase superfamily II)